jgi:hypothetical protein
MYSGGALRIVQDRADDLPLICHIRFRRIPVQVL